MTTNLTSPSTYSGAGSISPPPEADTTSTLPGWIPVLPDMPNPTAGLNGYDPFLPPPDIPLGPAPAPVNAPPAPAVITPPPSTAPTPTTSAPPTPNSTPEPDNDSVYLENADRAEEIEADHWILLGNVRIRYRKYIVTCDRADIDTYAQTAVFTGHVLMTAPTGEVVQGGPKGKLKIDLNANTYLLQGSEAVIPASEFGIGLIEPLQIYGGVVSGANNFVDARGSSFTTCDFPDPHYHFTASDMYIVPGTRLVAKHVSLYRRNKRIITWPYLVVPLDRRASTLTPVIGEDPDEGFYARFAIAYLLASRLPGILHIDLLQKKGIGTGFDQSYGNPSNIKDGSGDVSLYNLPDKSLGRDTFTGSWNHKQEFGNVMTSLSTQYENDSYYLGNETSSTLSQQVNLSRNVGNLSDSFSTNVSMSNYGGSTSDSITSSLDQTYSPTTKEKLITKFDLTDYSSSYSGSSSGTDELDSDIEYDQTDPAFDWKLLANKYSLLGSSGGLGESSLGGLEKLPEFDLSTDPVRARLLEGVLPKAATLDFSLGSYIEPESNEQGQRLNFGLNTGLTTFKLDSWQAIDLSGSFLQRFYSDDGAQYVLSDHDVYRMKIGKRSTASLTYDYLRPYGFTPFEFDYSGVTNLVSANMAYQETKSFQLNLSTGYDINAARQTLFGPPQPWQNIALQTVYTPTDYFLWRQSASYDLNHGQLIDFTNNWSIRGRGGQALDFAARYTPQEHRVSAITETLDLPYVVDKREDSGWRLQAVAGYDGITDAFDYSGVALTRSWHDWETSFIYQDNPIGFQTGSTFTFNIRLKAFPAYQPFGVGAFGQSEGGSLGTVY